jgi:hypothetical protein
MLALTALTMTILTTDPAAGDGWKVAARSDGLTIYSRERKDSAVKELKAVGLIDAAPGAVWKAIRDYPNYKKTMPYTEVSEVLAREGGDKITWFYSVINAPLVDRRDYVIKLVDTSDWKDGTGYLKVEWTAANEKAPELKKGVVRVGINDGYWKLEPREDGTKTFTTYYLYTDPGGSLPRWVVNKANGSAVPDVFKAVRKVAQAAE